MSTCMCCDRELTKKDQGSTLHLECSDEWRSRKREMRCIFCGKKRGVDGHSNMDCVSSIYRGYPGSTI